MNIFSFVAPIYDVLFSSLQNRQGSEVLHALAPLAGKKVLDLGGGTGKLAARLATADADVWVLDASPQMIKRASRVLPAHRALLGNAEKLPFADYVFDAITMVDVFHHISRQDQALQECYRTLKPGGVLIIVEFNPQRFLVRLLAGFERLLGEPSLFLAPEDLGTMLISKNYTVVRTKSLSSDDYLTVAEKPVKV